MEILFINPSGGYPHEYPPLGILYIASYVREHGYGVSFFDQGACLQDSTEGLVDLIDNVKPGIFAFSLYTSNLINTYATMKFLKDRYPCATIIVGGPHATALPKHTMEECPAIDFLVYGEGELTTLELIESMRQGEKFNNVDGIYYRTKQGIVNTRPREFISNLDDLPFPAYELSKGFRYQLDPIKKSNKIATIMSSRGCPYNCTFCNKAVFGNTYRKRSPENVVKEIIYQRDHWGASEIYFMDDLFTSEKNWLDGFYAELERNNINLPWKCLARVRGLDLEDYIKMKQHGCYVVQFGVESGNEKMLKSINKNITKVDCLKAFKECRQAGINTYGFFIFGHQNDNAATISQTLDFAKKLNPDFVAFFTLVPFPGTAAYSFLGEGLRFSWERIRYVWSGARKFLPISICSVTSEELVKFEADAAFEYYGRMNYLLKNIIFSRSELVIKLLKLKYFIFHSLRIIKHSIKRDRIFKIYEKAKN